MRKADATHARLTANPRKKTYLVAPLAHPESSLVKHSPSQHSSDAAVLPCKPVVMPGGADRQSWIGETFPSHWRVVRPMLALMVFTAVFRLTAADVAISAVFYDPVNQRWPLVNAPLCSLFYRQGTLPGTALFVAGLVLIPVGLLRRRPTWVRGGAFLAIVFAVGPGLIVNEAFKQHWGRPRPNQVREFGGDYEFAAVGSPGSVARHNSSFPSGHAAVAFYLMTPAFVVNPHRRGWSTRLLTLGATFGGAMAAVRVMQGGHFTSDVVWSAGIVYFTAVAMAKVILRPAAKAIHQPVAEPISTLQNAA